MLQPFYLYFLNSGNGVRKYISSISQSLRCIARSIASFLKAYRTPISNVIAIFVASFEAMSKQKVLVLRRQCEVKV